MPNESQRGKLIWLAKAKRNRHSPLPNRRTFADIVRNPITAIAAAIAAILGIAGLISGYIQLSNELKFVIAVIATALLILAVVYGLKEWIAFTISERIRQDFVKVREEIQELRSTSIASLSPEAKNEAFYQDNSTRYGLSYEELLVHGTLDEQGAMKVWRNSKVKAYVSGIAKLDHYLISESPDEKNIQVDLQWPNQFKQLTKEIQRVSSRELYLTIGISEPLMPNETLEFTVAEIAPNGSVSKTKAELQKRLNSGKKHFPYESLHWEITRPTKHFQLKLILASSLKPEDKQFDVWYGRSRIRHAEEYSRISDNNWFRVEPVGDQIELILDVMYPISTLIYAIRWIPSYTLTNTVSL